jgi:protein involved in polysaccharide export with SLBB domain
MMAKFSPVFLLLQLMVIWVIPSATGQVPFHHDPSVLKDPTGYKLRYGDRVQITVRGEQDCTSEGRITNDGKIEIVHIGEVFVVGKSFKQAQEHIEELYIKRKIFARPDVKIRITKYVERVVFLTGSVNRKGPYAFPPEVEAMNIVEVIARAGGFSDIARKNKVYVTRTFFDERGNQTESKTYEIDVESMSSGSSSKAKRFWIYPGDRIEVPERLL